MFDHVWIDKSALQYPATHSICERLAGVPADVVDDIHLLKHPLDINLAKRQLILTLNKGAALKSCQGTAEGAICCGYHTIDITSGCPCECTYCILQHYLANNPMTTIYVNIEEILSNVGARLEAEPGRHFRIGTGELSDSLAYDYITGYSRIIVGFFAVQKNASFEFKTKTVNIKNLLGLKHNGRTVVSWSVNPQNIIATEEKGTASLKERLSAAKKCIEAGYRVGFHFDPMIHYKGWEKEYKVVVDEIFKRVPPEFIAWISLGALRFPAGLRQTAEKRYPKTRIFSGEFVPSNGKMRYFRPIREEMYKKVRSWISARAPRITPYLCMETPAVNQRFIDNPP